MATTTPDRYQMQGTAGADSLQLGSLLAFDWVPALGEQSGTTWNEAGHAVWDFPSAAAGHVVFDGVSATAPFDARAGALRFAFTYGPEFALDSVTTDGSWHWNPATSVLDPQQVRGTVNFGDLWNAPWYIARYDYLLGATGVSVSGFEDYYTVGSRESGTWQPAVGPIAAEVTAGAGDDTVLGAGGNDVLLGGDGADHLDGGDGADTIDGQRDNDLILAGDGTDVASGGSGYDTLRGGEGADTLYGHQGDDLLDGGDGADWLIGGADRVQGWGFDTASYAHSLGPVAIDLAAGTARGGEAEGDRLLFIQALQGSGFGDVLAGDAAVNRLQGDGGNDTLDGAAGDDVLIGGRGDDLLDGGDGPDAAMFAGRRADYQVTLLADGQQALVHDLNTADGDEGTERLTSVELLRFADATVAVVPPPTLRGPRAVFTADDGVTGRELWVTDGTAAGTRIVADLEPGRSGSDAFNFATFGNGRSVFSAVTAATGREPWVTDGTAAGTHLLQDIGHGTADSDPWEFVLLQDGRMLFSAAGPAGREPWITDGTAAGTHMLRDIDAVGESSPGAFAVLHPGLAVFSAGDATAGREPWVTDGTSAGTHRLADLLPGAMGSDPYNFTPLGTGQAAFSATSPGLGTELWITDGTAAGTRLVRDIEPGSGGSDPYGFFQLDDGRALFQADTAATGAELWITDGSTAGTRLVKDIAPGPSRSFPTGFTALGDGRVVFDAYADANYDREIWITDGTAAGTQQLRDIWPGSNGSFPTGFTALGGSRVVFAAETSSPDLLGRELWITDGTTPGTRLLRDLWPGTLDDAGYAPADGNPYLFLALGQDRVIFGASDGVHGGELWVTDGTAAGTVLVADINPAPGQSSAPDFLTALWSGGAAPVPDLALIA